MEVIYLSTKVQLNFKLDKEDKEKLIYISFENHKTIAQYLRYITKEVIDKYEKEKGVINLND